MSRYRLIIVFIFLSAADMRADIRSDVYYAYIKHLLIESSWGEAYFAGKLLDYELSSNNGNWQWAAGTGCGAAPYFRIFNPETQQKKFDPENEYVRRWVKKYGKYGYPEKIVDHDFAGQRAITIYKTESKYL